MLPPLPSTYCRCQSLRPTAMISARRALARADLAAKDGNASRSGVSAGADCEGSLARRFVCLLHHEILVHRRPRIASRGENQSRAKCSSTYSPIEGFGPVIRITLPSFWALWRGARLPFGRNQLPLQLLQGLPLRFWIEEEHNQELDDRHDGEEYERCTACPRCQDGEDLCY